MKYDVADADVPVRLTFKQTVFVLEKATRRRRSCLSGRLRRPSPWRRAGARGEGRDPIRPLECLFNGDDKNDLRPHDGCGRVPTRDRLDVESSTSSTGSSTRRTES